VFIEQAWRGRLPLKRVFWLYGVLTSSAVTAVFVALVRQGGPGLGLRQLLLAAFVPYTVWLLVSIWRCSDNVRNRYYGRMARAMTVAWAVNAALLIVFTELDVVL
jgi:hypothetical protein